MIEAVQRLNIADALRERAKSDPDQVAVLTPRGETRTFGELDRESEALARGLVLAGIAPGTRTVLMVPPSVEFFALTFALFKAGIVPVVVDPGMGIRNLGICLEEAAPGAFIGIGKAHLARRLFRWARDTVETTITVGGLSWLAQYELRSVLARGERDDGGTVEFETPGPDELAAILFTSGSTGAPKGAVYTHRIFTSQVRQLREIFGIEPGEIDLCTFPLFALFAPGLGMTAIVPEMDPTRPGRVDPPKILDAIEHHGATNLFGSPALIRRVGDYAARHDAKLPTLRRVISAGAPVPAETLATFQSLLADGVEVFTPYGATESLPVACIGSHTVLGRTAAATADGRGVCVGHPVPSIDATIIRVSDEPIATWSDELCVPTGEIGEIVVQGEVVTREYYSRPEATALAKIQNADGSVRHRMGDLGYFDEEGRLWFCGRKSHRVSTANGDLYSVCCEGIFNVHPDVRRTALVGVPGREETKGATRVDEPVLCVELERSAPGGHAARERIARELREIGAKYDTTAEITEILFHREFPVDVRHNAKIFREKLAEWAAARRSRARSGR